MDDMQQDSVESQVSSEPQEVVLTEGQQFQLQLMETEKQFRNGVNWFYWIAGLSLVNSVLWLTGQDWSFLAGLGATQLIDAVVIGLIEETQVSESIKYVAFGMDILIAGVYVLFGFLGLRRYKAAIITGMVFYALDGLIFLLAMDILSIGFHAFALFCIFNGLKAMNRLNALESAISPDFETEAA
ncbi:MAG: hypothetical protein ACYTER_02895 [Planctomycetota bacterium]